jgi:hypothetical protein
MHGVVNTRERRKRVNAEDDAEKVLALSCENNHSSSSKSQLILRGWIKEEMMKDTSVNWEEEGGVAALVRGNFSSAIALIVSARSRRQEYFVLL